MALQARADVRWFVAWCEEAGLPADTYASLFQVRWKGTVVGDMGVRVSGRVLGKGDDSREGEGERESDYTY